VQHRRAAAVIRVLVAARMVKGMSELTSLADGQVADRAVSRAVSIDRKRTEQSKKAYLKARRLTQSSGTKISEIS
jgi:hypothetical protein